MQALHQLLYILCVVCRTFGGCVMKPRHGLMKKILPSLVKIVEKI